MTSAELEALLALSRRRTLELLDAVRGLETPARALGGRTWLGS